MDKLLRSPKPENDSELGFLLQELWVAVQYKLRLRSRPGLYTVEQTDLGQLLDFEPGQGGAATVSSKTHRVKSAPLDKEYLICRTWNGTTEGSTDIYVAKNFDSRRPATEILPDGTYTYTYTGSADTLNGYRTAVGGANNEQQIVTPLWRVNCLIKVDRINFSGVDDPDGNDIKLIEVSARAWAKV